MASVFPLFIPIVLDVCRTLITILDSLHTHRPHIQQVNKQQSKLDMKQQTGSKLGKEYVKAVYSHPAYLTFLQRTSCEMPSWMTHKLESRVTGEISTTSIRR